MAFQTKTAQREEFKRILAMPLAKRQEQGLDTPDAICEKLGISIPSYYKWIKQDGLAPHFNIQDFLGQNKEQVVREWMRFLKKHPSARNFELFLKSIGELVEKREDTVKFEFKATDRIKIAQELHQALRAEYRTSGYCPICHQRKALRNQTLLDFEPEHVTS